MKLSRSPLANLKSPRDEMHLSAYLLHDVQDMDYKSKRRGINRDGSKGEELIENRTYELEPRTVYLR